MAKVWKTLLKKDENKLGYKFSWRILGMPETER